MKGEVKKMQFHCKIKEWNKYYCEIHIKYKASYEIDLATYLIRHCDVEYKDLSTEFDSKYDHIMIYGIGKEQANKIIESLNK